MSIALHLYQLVDRRGEVTSVLDRILAHATLRGIEEQIERQLFVLSPHELENRQIDTGDSNLRICEPFESEYSAGLNCTVIRVGKLGPRSRGSISIIAFWSDISRSHAPARKAPMIRASGDHQMW
jgi:hypothetical protein